MAPADPSSSSAFQSNMFEKKRLIKGTMGSTSYSSSSTEHTLGGTEIERKKLVNTLATMVSHTGKCEIEGCETSFNAQGVCSKGVCCYGRCDKKFCMEHDGKHLVRDPNLKGRVCINCALKVNYCKNVIMVIFFVILFALLAFMIGLILLFDDESRGFSN